MTDPTQPVEGSARSWARSRSRRCTLSADQLQRQGRITNLAFDLLGDCNRAIGFLNSFHDVLDAKPIELAGGSVDGFNSVQRELQQLAVGEAGGAR
ncbi:MAG: hypothetical protein KGM17_00035 [Sphingomonadales bacterium]|nr:hypothetical protein [Sphingomonadales bacterium]